MKRIGRGLSLALLLAMWVMTSACQMRDIQGNVIQLPVASTADDSAAVTAASLTELEATLASEATAYLAARLGVDAGAIMLTAIEEVTWPDASLGCPQAGYVYASVLTPGYALTLQVDDASYEVHSAAFSGGPLAECAD